MAAIEKVATTQNTLNKYLSNKGIYSRPLGNQIFLRMEIMRFVFHNSDSVMVWQYR